VSSLLLFDIDHFKSINDQHGHAAGDAVLTEFCRVAKAQLRPVDLFARIGGEEFACLLVDVDAAKAAGVAERVRFAFAGATHASNGKMFGATVSVGVACAEASDVDLSALLIIADRALYRAKHGGRNQVVEETNGSVESPQAASRRG
jgi:diguanylate cyclase (GGDEF)-like protein